MQPCSSSKGKKNFFIYIPTHTLCVLRDRRGQINVSSIIKKIKLMHKGWGVGCPLFMLRGVSGRLVEPRGAWPLHRRPRVGTGRLAQDSGRATTGRDSGGLGGWTGRGSRALGPSQAPRSTQRHPRSPQRAPSGPLSGLPPSQDPSRSLHAAAGVSLPCKRESGSLRRGLGCPRFGERAGGEGVRPGNTVGAPPQAHGGPRLAARRPPGTPCPRPASARPARLRSVRGPRAPRPGPGLRRRRAASGRRRGTTFGGRPRPAPCPRAAERSALRRRRQDTAAPARLIRAPCAAPF